MEEFTPVIDVSRVQSRAETITTLFPLLLANSTTTVSAEPQRSNVATLSINAFNDSSRFWYINTPTTLLRLPLTVSQKHFSATVTICDKTVRNKTIQIQNKIIFVSKKDGKDPMGTFVAKCRVLGMSHAESIEAYDTKSAIGKTLVPSRDRMGVDE